MKRKELQRHHSDRRKIERAAWALWREAAKLPPLSKHATVHADKLIGLCTRWSWSLWSIMLAHYADTCRRRHGLIARECCAFARDVLFILFAMRARDSWEPRILSALAENANLTLAEAAKIGGISKSTITRHKVLGARWHRQVKPKHVPELYVHDGATEDSEPQD